MKQIGKGRHPIRHRSANLVIAEPMPVSQLAGSAELMNGLVGRRDDAQDRRKQDDRSQNGCEQSRNTSASRGVHEAVNDIKDCRRQDIRRASRLDWTRCELGVHPVFIG